MTSLQLEGIQSDPWKVASMRAMEREWSACLPPASRESPSKCGVTDKEFNRVGEFLLLAGKHTWGRGCGAGNLDHAWGNKAWAIARASENTSSDTSFASCERGWTEQRMQLAAAAEAAAGTPLGGKLSAAVAALAPVAPDLAGLDAVPVAQWADRIVLVPAAKSRGGGGSGGGDGGGPSAGTSLRNATTAATQRVVLGFDRQTGSITTLTNEATGVAYAGANNPLAELWYKTTSQADELAYARNYSVTLPDPWGGMGLGVRPVINLSFFSVEESALERR